MALASTLAGVAWPEAAGAQGQAVRLWVEVRDDKGQVPADLAAADLELREGGAAIAPAAVEAQAPRRFAASRPAHFVVWIDPSLAGKGAVRRAAEGFANLAGRLSELGEVELVIAGDEAESVLTARDELVLGERFRWSATQNPGLGQVLELRATTLAEAMRLRRAPGSTPEEVAARVEAGVEEEMELLRERQSELVAWAASRLEDESPFDRPRVLFLVTDGFDLDPLAFYGEHLDEAAWRALVRETPEALGFESTVESAARGLAALGWTVVPVALEAPAGGGEAIDPAYIEGTDVRGNTSGGAGVTIRPGAIFRRGEKEAAEAELEAAKEAPAATFVDPAGPLRLYAEASGGEVVRTPRALGDAVARFGQRFEVSYLSTLEVADDLRRLEVTSRRPGLVVRGPRWRSRTVPESVATVWIERLLHGRPSPGELDVAAVVEVEEGDGETVDGETTAHGRLDARLQITDLYGGEDDEEAEPRPRDAAFRVTVGVAMPGKKPVVKSEVVTGQDLWGLQEWRYTSALELPPEASEVAVVVEELGRGRWGGSRAGVVSGEWTEVATRPQAVEIERPEEELLRGRVKFTARALDSRVERVVFELDERPAAEADRRPFEARIDLGRSPRRQTLTAIAYDVSGEELGRDSVVLNAGSGGLEVEITKPSDGRGTGEVEVEASVAVPLERRLDRVLFFWNSEPVATLYAPPFRQRLHIPPEKPIGYVRVVAMLDDGTVAEDVIFMNGPGAGERVDVNLVELYVVVQNEEGRPVRGLEQADFEIREEGRRQEIATFSDASDLPLTLGMAIDSSASMFVKLPGVQQAAIRFLRSTFAEEDRAFVVDFDTQPRLVRPTTGRLDSVERSIQNLEPNGTTALWESIVYSLVQLQGVRGRKALIVFSDGADEDDEFPFRSCLDFSKKMGVPIYLILMRKEPEPGGALSLFTRSFKSRVDRLVGTTGGRVFYAKEYDNLDDVYSEIERELRSQYLLTYYPDSNGGSAWRDVEVEVLRKGLSPRTLSGYWP